MSKDMKSKSMAVDSNKMVPKFENLQVDMGTVLTDVERSQWRVGTLIGTGGHGKIYTAGRVDEENYDCAVKFEPFNSITLIAEITFYKRFAQLENIQRFQCERDLKSLGMPHMIGYGAIEIHGLMLRFILMPRYGRDISELMRENCTCLPVITKYRLAIQMLDVYEYIHSCGYIHGDLKGSNILLGFGKGCGDQAYLLDFGLSRPYTSSEFQPDTDLMHVGTIFYTSRDAHQGVATMRGDLESLGYNLIKWSGVMLPWMGKGFMNAPEKVQNAKEAFMDDINTNLKCLFKKGVPKPIAQYMIYVTEIRYNEKPDYNKCRQIFESELKVLKATKDGDLQFKIAAGAQTNYSRTCTQYSTQGS